jgi:SOS-response transcriptional repressor LexA
MTLPLRQQQVYDYIVKFIKKHGESPTLAQIRVFTGLSQTQQLIKSLVDKGYLGKTDKRERILYVINRKGK